MEIDNDKEKYKKQRQELAKKYKARKVYRWLGYADEEREQPLVNLITQVANSLNIAPSYFYTIAIGEGLGKKYVGIDAYYKHGVLRTDLAICGLNDLGLDDFGDDFPRVKNFLPNDYNEGDEFFKAKGKRPKDFGRKIVNTASFKDLESGLEAFGAILKHRRELFLSHTKQLNLGKPTEDQIAFWNYCYFQGEGRAKMYLKQYGLDFSKTPPVNMKEVKELSLERLATWRYVQMNNLFER